MTEREDVLEMLANCVRKNEKDRLEFCKNVGITLDEYYVKNCGDFEIEDMIRAYRRGKNKVHKETRELLRIERRHAYIKGLRTMANALKEYDRTNGAWTDYFEHTVEAVEKKLLSGVAK